MIKVEDAVITAIKAKLAENGIDMPDPTSQILFHDQTEETDRDRSRQREGWPAGQGEVPAPRSVACTIYDIAKEYAPKTTKKGGDTKRAA